MNVRFLMTAVTLSLAIAASEARAQTCTNDVDCQCGDVCSWATSNHQCVSASSGDPGWCSSNADCLYAGQTCTTSSHSCSPAFTASASVCSNIVACTNDVDCACGEVCAWDLPGGHHCVAANTGDVGWCTASANTNTCLYSGQTCSGTACTPAWSSTSVCDQATTTGSTTSAAATTSSSGTTGAAAGTTGAASTGGSTGTTGQTCALACSASNQVCEMTGFNCTCNTQANCCDCQPLGDGASTGGSSTTSGAASGTSSGGTTAAAATASTSASSSGTTGSSSGTTGSTHGTAASSTTGTTGADGGSGSSGGGCSTAPGALTLIAAAFGLGLSRRRRQK